MDNTRNKPMLVVLGSIAVLGVWLLISRLLSPDPEALLVSSNFWQRIQKEVAHPLLKRQQTITQRSIIDHDYLTQTEMYFPLPSSLSGNQSGFVSPLYLSGVVQLRGKSSYYPWGPGKASTTLTSQRSARSGSWTIGQYTLDATVLNVRSGTDTRVNLNSLDIRQSGHESVDLLMRRAFLQEYENKRILATWSALPSLFTARLFSTLAEQPSQHVIPTRSGEVVTIVDGPSIGRSGIVSAQNQLTTTLRFPSLGMRAELQQLPRKQHYTLTVSHYRMTGPLLQGEITFDKNFASLQSFFEWGGNTKTGLIRTGTHSSTFTPTSFLSIDLPGQRTPWTAVKKLRDEAEKSSKK